MNRLINWFLQNFALAKPEDTVVKHRRTSAQLRDKAADLLHRAELHSRFADELEDLNKHSFKGECCER